MSDKQAKTNRGSFRLKDQSHLLSALLIVGGLTWLVIAWLMPTTVSTGYSIVGGELIRPTEVHNIGLQDDRRNHITLSVACIFLGVLVLILSKAGSFQNNRASPPKLGADAPSPRSLSNADYKLWLIDRYGIVKSDVLGSFVCGGKEFRTADEAIEYADQLDSSDAREMFTDSTNGHSEQTHSGSSDLTLGKFDRLRRTVRRHIWAVLVIALLGGGAAALFSFFTTTKDAPEDQTPAPDAVSTMPVPQVIEVAPQPKIPPQPLPSPTSVVSSAWLIGWWAEDGFCEGDAGQSFLREGSWGRWGVNGSWSLTGNRLRIEERELIADTESGGPETLDPPRLISGEITKADKNSFVFKTTSGITRFERCLD